MKEEVTYAPLAALEGEEERIVGSSFKMQEI
jgi:hypothetical protein